MIHRLGFVLALAIAACDPAGSSRNTEYPHSSNYVLTDGQTYVKNPDVKLKREYWIIARLEDGNHAMLPRPDGDPRIVEECATKGPLASMFQNAALCQTASQSTLARVNALTAEEALKTSTFLHGKLRFVVTEGAGVPPRVEPFAHTDDLLAICKTFPSDRDGVLKSVCDEEFRFENASSRPSIARVYTAEECGAIAPRLNELYGIP
jgi:hypothetical protein